MIAVDTNLLVYAHREDSPWFEKAYACVGELAMSKGFWAIPWPCVHEFLAIVTHPGIFRPPTPVAAALDQVAAWMESPSLVLLSEGNGHWSQLEALLSRGAAVGGQVHDARVAALCLSNGIRELWSADRDFGRFPALKVRNPLV
jgi:toxin-antitoxin system PIN domain toxin